MVKNQIIFIISDIIFVQDRTKLNSTGYTSGYRNLAPNWNLALQFDDQQHHKNEKGIKIKLTWKI